uniref:carbamoyl-phosphate synthase arginine-specific small subunit n=1 Tax=Erythrolobus coxiae TaxID=362235 RepID=UPI001FCD65EA|nr:carbamoyl-phosphate synthase arginine-specific small subunit [Erythrolobus coxiae]UNJ17626.1 carbamoyl-phosphate synthase arginine-specific small subunit [Erythrolobus coxiae]
MNIIMKEKKAILVLENGSVYRGWSFNKNNTSFGEIVFNTGMTGYQEIMTDPSYKQQIINFCQPEFGNTGINNDDNESQHCIVSGIITKNITQYSSSWRQQESVINTCDTKNIISIHGIDTRQLTKEIRSQGAMRCIISNENLESQSLFSKFEDVPKMEGTNLVDVVTTKTNYEYKFSETLESIKQWYIWDNNFKAYTNKNISIVILDFGYKKSIADCLQKHNCTINIVSCNSSLETILSYKPDGILLSNGPGDPSTIPYIIPILKELTTLDIPIFGICMGHQLLSLTFGYETFKLKFGHRGLNHPCGYEQKVEITSQNHGFATKTKNNDINHLNLNDTTIAGFYDTKTPIYSVQYHPEASPGPHDTDYLFSDFIEIIIHQKIKKLKATII